jgi:hypothetical protein
MKTNFDYTAKRVGSLVETPYGKRKIVVCAKCGLRGIEDGVIPEKDGLPAVQMITHASHLTLVPFPINRIDKRCYYALPATVKAS